MVNIGFTAQFNCGIHERMPLEDRLIMLDAEVAHGLFLIRLADERARIDARNLETTRATLARVTKMRDAVATKIAIHNGALFASK